MVVEILVNMQFSITVSCKQLYISDEHIELCQCIQHERIKAHCKNHNTKTIALWLLGCYKCSLV